VTGLSDLMALFIDLECLCCKQMQRPFNVFKNTKLIENQFSRSKVQLTRVGTSHKTLERLALRESLRFHRGR
jgi:hypothetical protein